MYAEMAQGIKHLLRGVRVPSTQKKDRLAWWLLVIPAIGGEEMWVPRASWLVRIVKTGKPQDQQKNSAPAET